MFLSHFLISDESLPKGQDLSDKLNYLILYNKVHAQKSNSSK